ncbi:TPA: hypothetical protein SMI27_000857 [Serratia liquefaciens]|nr:hypothetical protein [Serratia liquefaciens]
MDKLHDSRKQFEEAYAKAKHFTDNEDWAWQFWQASRASVVVEPTYFVLKLDESNEWGYAEDLTVYEKELDASKAKDDFGGEIIPVIDLRSIGLSIKGE